MLAPQVISGNRAITNGKESFLTTCSRYSVRVDRNLRSLGSGVCCSDSPSCLGGLRLLAANAPDAISSG